MTIVGSNLRVVTDGKLLIDGVSVTVTPGEVVAIAGANGAGKTTLLSVLAGTLLPESGDVQLSGRRLGEMALEERARRVAVLTQHATLDFPFIAREVIAMGRIPHFTGRVRDTEIVGEVIARMDLQALADRVYTTLSGGERQRVQIGRVLAQVWDVLADGFLLLDEPTAPLDLAYQMTVLELVRQLAAAGAGIAIVIHDINLGARFSDRMLLMKSGRVIASGEPLDVITAANIGEAFGVVVDVTHTEDGAPLVYTRSRRMSRSGNA